MRRFLLTSCIAMLPGLALAQGDAGAPPPPPAPSGPGMMGGAGMMGGPDGGPGMMGQGDWHHHGDPGEMLMQFYAANTTHNGHLTLAQAKAAGLQPVIDHFADIDVHHRGYVTFYDIAAWHLDDMAKHMEQQADALRARD